MALRIALVDDEQVARAYIGSMKLWHDGEFELAVSASSGRELLKKLEQIPVDIVLMDVFMPDLDGVQLSGELKKRYPQMDLVAISNFDGYDYVRPIMKNGAQDYLLKSRLTEESLRDLLRRLRDQRAQNSGEASQYREQLRHFLEGNAPWPFPLDGSQPVACFGVLEDAEQESLYRRIEDLLEEGASPDLRRTAVCCEKGIFLLLLRFYDRVSIASIQQEAHYLCVTLSDSVSSVFRTHFRFDVGPVMSNHAALPPYILERLRGRSGGEEEKSQRDELTLTDTRQLLSLLESGDSEGLSKLLGRLFVDAAGYDLRHKLFLGRSILELARSAAREWQIGLEMPPEGNALFAWMQSMQWKDLCEEMRSLFAGLAEKRRAQSGTGYSDPVRKAAAYLEQHYREPFSLTDTAQAAQVNESYLSRLFRKETGMTMGDYATRLKLDRARQLLLEGMPIKAVAAEVGYVQYTHFLRVFKQNEGCTIKEFLRNVKNG